jgi:GTP-binding protein LepA
MSAAARRWSYELPLNEVVFDFYDRLKIHQPRLCQLRLSPDRPPRRRPREDEIMVNNEPVDALSMIVHRAPPKPAAATCASG